MPYDPIESEESEEQEEAPPPKRRKQQHRRQIEAAVETPEELEEEVEHGSMQMQADRRSGEPTVCVKRLWLKRRPSSPYLQAPSSQKDGPSQRRNGADLFAGA